MAVIIIFNALSVLFSGAAAIALFTNAGDSAHWSMYLAGAFCIIVTVYQAVSLFFSLSLQRRLKKARDQRELRSDRDVSALRAANTSQLVPAPSVTERTTELLERN